MEKTDLLSLELHELEAFMAELGEPKYRAKQLFTGMHRGVSPDALAAANGLTVDGYGDSKELGGARYLLIP